VCCCPKVEELRNCRPAFPARAIRPHTQTREIVRIEKWYLDCVTPSGAGMIGYAARLSIGPLALRVEETMHWRNGEPAGRSRSALGGALPVVTAEGVEWASPQLNATGRWSSVVPALPATVLHEDPAGRIEWTCFCPAARSSVSLAGQRYTGSGYAERLVVTRPLSRLPLRELHWGRFITEAQSFIWLRWLGSEMRSWCYHNGRPVAVTAPDPRQLEWAGHHLQLAEGAALRSGLVGEHVLPDARCLRRLLPAAIRNLDETKWCSAGLLTDADGRQHQGWAVHEIVRFP
jgi:hypothetical protein